MRKQVVANIARPGRCFVLLWAFRVKRGRESRFEQVYGPEGDWARLFAQSEDYLGTELHCNVNNRGCYLTADFWASQAAYESFRRKHGQEYKALDRQCGSLTERETPLGSFACLGRSKHDQAK
jgi:hypothetical protein